MFVLSLATLDYITLHYITKLRRFVKYFGGVFNKTIIPFAIVGYEMIIANLALHPSLAIYHLISNTGLWNDCEILSCYHPRKM